MNSKQKNPVLEKTKLELEQCSMANSELIRNQKGQRSEKNQATKNIRYSFLLHMNCNSTDQLDLLLPVAKTKHCVFTILERLYGSTLWNDFPLFFTVTFWVGATLYPWCLKTLVALGLSCS